MTATYFQRCDRCGHNNHDHGRFYGRSWTEHCKVKGCTCPAFTETNIQGAVK